MTSNAELIGRDDVDDVDAILAVTNTAVDEVEHAVPAAADALFTWNYERSRPALVKLYEKAKASQWNANDLPWEIEVDQEKVAADNQNQNGIGQNMDLEGTPFENWGEKEWIEFGVESQNWTLSQFLHGEQGALIVASQLVGGVPWIDAKYYAGTQTMDEARHVEVFARYLREKLEWEWPINESLKELLDATIKDARWDFKYLGMQIIIEGLAMAAFGNLFQVAQEPLLTELLRYVMKDESRHVAFGVLSLKDYYTDMPANELRDREDFVIYACELMRNRLVGDQIARVMGWNQNELRDVVMASPLGSAFRRMLFARVVPNLKRLGLISPRVREAFTKLGIIEFEDFDPTEQDRKLGLA
jgi:hypothetical protein